jgi:GT2 family glycosyltransferase/Flp pilus assembly protein TadD/SAM-dependent methyltransferase
MHQSSYEIIKGFRELVLKHFQQDTIRLLDVGSYGVNGTYKQIFDDPTKFLYTGLDVTLGPNVDYVPADPYKWMNLGDESFDVIISGQAFEHIEFPWLIMNEMSRVLRKNGLICIVAPSRGPEHKYPVDCWRFYPDGFRALAKWADLETIESKTLWGVSGFTDGSDQWGDSYGIFFKGPAAGQNKKPLADCGKNYHLGKSIENTNNPLNHGKQNRYYGFVREDVLSTVIKHNIKPKRILEIGCAAGATGKKFKEKMNPEYYVGVEMVEPAALIASRHLDRVIVADIERTDLRDFGLSYNNFDLLLVLDVLEHLYDPWDALSVLSQFVKPKGFIMASIPNIQNITVLKNLVEGKWSYEEAGILDATHLRFFTLEESEKLFKGAGLTIKGIEHVLNPQIQMDKLTDFGNSFKESKIEIRGLSKKEMINLFTYQFILLGQKPEIQTEFSLGKPTEKDDTHQEKGAPHFALCRLPLNAVPGLTSIIILTFNQLEYTKKCIDSIIKFTPEPIEIIFVDNGSTDGTVQWLKKLIDKNKIYKLIENKENLGFARGCNQGINSSSGEYILLLNNDVIVTENWLSGMLENLNRDQDIGIVGPMTNNISGIQKDPFAIYSTIKEIPEYARAFREKNRYRSIPLRRIVGFCMLFRRSLADKIGLLDENFGTGNFEDDDYCLRAALEGYHNSIVGDVFIHHYGSRTFIGNKINYSETMGDHRKVFSDKWDKIPVNTELGKKLSIMNQIERAEELCSRGEFDKAIAVCVEGIGQFPDEPLVYQKMADMLLSEKNYQEAIEALIAMPDQDNQDIKTCLIMGYCKEGLGFDDEAENYANKVLDFSSGNAVAMNLKGILAYKRGDQDKADEWFSKAMNQDPGYGEPYTYLGVMKRAEGRGEEGLSLLEKGFILSPNKMDCANLYHTALTEMEEFSRGEKKFRSARALYPNNQRIAFLKIDLLLKQGKNVAAMEAIEEAMVNMGMGDGMLQAALSVREKIGPLSIKGSKHKSLSISMIVKNEEKHISKCLMSVKPVVDEIIVVDTGSNDRTKDIARAFGARVLDFEWKGDFSKARNYSLSQARGSWIFSLDADEVISSTDYRALRYIVENSKPAAYIITTRNYSNELNAHQFGSNKGEYPLEEAGLGWFPSEKIRLFPNGKGIYFENPVHEIVENTVARAGLPKIKCSIPVHHYGRFDEVKLKEKGEAYYLLGKKKLKKKGNEDPKAIFELAVQAGELKKTDEATLLFEKLVQLDPLYPMAQFNLGFAYLELGRFSEAFFYSKKAFELNPEKKECALNYAHCQILVGNISEARDLLENTIKSQGDYPPAMALLAIVEAILKMPKCYQILKDLKQRNFECSHLLHDMAEALSKAGRFKQALCVFELIIKSGNLREDTKTVLEECYRANGDSGFFDMEGGSKELSPGHHPNYL